MLQITVSSQKIRAYKLNEYWNELNNYIDDIKEIVYNLGSERRSFHDDCRTD